MSDNRAAIENNVEDGGSYDICQECGGYSKKLQPGGCTCIEPMKDSLHPEGL